MSETKEQGEACADTPPSVERAKREYRSHVGPGKVAMVSQYVHYLLQS